MEEIRELKKKTINLNERRVIISVIQNSKLFKRRIRTLIARRGESGSRFQCLPLAQGALHHLKQFFNQLNDI